MSGAGGAFRYAGLAPMFNDVGANPASFERYIRDMVAACQRKRVTFRFDTDVRREPELLAPFDRIVVATGASYPLGTGALAMGLLERGAGRWPIVSRIMTAPKVRDWFYYRARKATGEHFAALAKPGQIVIVIGDAAKARQEQGGDRQRLRGGAPSAVAGSQIKWRNADAADNLGGAGRARSDARRPRPRRSGPSLSEPPDHHRGALPGRRAGRCDGAADRAIGRQFARPADARSTIAAAAPA